MGSTKSNKYDNLSLALKIDDIPGPPTVDFSSSDTAFEAMCTSMPDAKSDDLDVFSKDVFVAAMAQSLEKARIEPADALKLMPFARRALDGELFDLYSKVLASHPSTPTVEKKDLSC